MSEKFEKLNDHIQRVFPDSKLERLSDQEIEALRIEYPKVPLHYIEFLQRIGWGRLGNSNFMIYSGLITPDNIFDSATAEELSGLVLFGDNFSGWMTGIDLNNSWAMVSIDHESLGVEVLGQQTLFSFIENRISCFED